MKTDTVVNTGYGMLLNALREFGIFEVKAYGFPIFSFDVDSHAVIIPRCEVHVDSLLL